MYQGLLKSPLGLIVIKRSDIGISAVEILDSEEPAFKEIIHPEIIIAQKQLLAYFSGDLKEFDLSFDLSGHPPFHLSVWQELQKIPYGETRSYSNIADALSSPGAVRAVGLANAKNPIAIILPCHRVIGKNGSLTGYAYGLETKKWLLSFELENSETKRGMLF